MTSPYTRLHRYFVIRRAGTPSSTIQLEYAAAVSCRDHEAPAWLIRHCEVGDAIASLPGAEQIAVRERWMATIHVEECDRAVYVAASKINAGARAQEDVSDWVRLSREAEFEADEGRRAVRRVDRSREYQRGMVGLVERLSG